MVAIPGEIPTGDQLKRLLEVIGNEPVYVRQWQGGGMMTNQKPDRFGRWVKQGNSLVYRLNKKGRNRARRRGEL